MTYAVEACRKVTHATREIAEAHITSLQAVGKAHADMHAYYCAFHGGWHCGRRPRVYLEPAREGRAEQR